MATLFWLFWLIFAIFFSFLPIAIVPPDFADDGRHGGFGAPDRNEKVTSASN